MVPQSNCESKVRQRVRIRFRKQGDLRLIGHRDLARSMERLFRRAGLRLGMSEGFHPKPRLSFPSALAVGIEGLDEVMELELAQTYSAEELLARLGAPSVPGLTFQSVEVLPPGTKKARLKSVTYKVPIPPDRRAPTAARLERLLAARSLPIQRTGGRAPIDLRESLEDASLHGDMLSMRFRMTGRAAAGVRDVLRVLELDDLEQTGTYARRTAVELQPELQP